MEERLQRMEQEIEAIRLRNIRVEADKAWETSLFRTIVIGGLIYIVAALVLALLKDSRFLANALIPPVGYILSVQSLPMIKRWWIKTYFKTKQ